MNILITKNGYLEIERAGKFVEQRCPLFYREYPCGDWCPLFGEPAEETYGNGKRISDLELCRATLSGHIEDLRGKG